MAINPETQYPGKVAPSTPDYPYGAARNITTPGDGTGTPWEAALVNDIFGWQQALLDLSGVVPSGDPDKVGASQYLEALSKVGVFKWQPAISYTPGALVIASNSSIYEAKDGTQGDDPTSNPSKWFIKYSGGVRPAASFLTTQDLVDYLTNTTNADFITGLTPKKLADISQLMLTSTTLSIAAIGDSITYGFENGGPNPPINGSTSDRAEFQWPETVGYAITQEGYPSSVTNLGFPGDKVNEALARWPDGSGGADVCYIMFGTNDAKENTTPSSPFQTVAQYVDTLTRMVQREQAQGTYAVIIAPPYYQQEDTTRQYRTRAYSDAARKVAELTGADFIDMSEAVRTQSGVFSDPAHFTGKGYNEMGYSVASHLLAFNHELPRISAYEDLSPQYNQVALGSPVVRDTSMNQAFCYQLALNEAIYVAADFEEDLIPIITTVERVASSTVSAVISGGGSRGGDSIANVNDGTNPDGRAVFKGPRIPRGKRVFRVQSNAGDATIERIQFVPVDDGLYTSFNRTAHRSALSGVTLEPSSAVFNSVVDTTRTLRERFVMEGRFDLPSIATKLNGFGVSALKDTNAGFPNKYVLFGRNGDDLTIRQYDSGSTTDTTVAAAFPAGVTSVNMRAEVFLDNIEIFIDNVSKGVFTGNISYTSECFAFMLNIAGNNPNKCEWLQTS